MRNYLLEFYEYFVEWYDQWWWEQQKKKCNKINKANATYNVIDFDRV